MPLDPITAIFYFLSTVEGQKLIDPLTKINTDFVNLLGKLITHTVNKLEPAAPAATPVKGT